MQRARKREKKFSCNYVCPDTKKQCGDKYATSYQLSQHKKIAGHKRKRRQRPAQKVQRLGDEEAS